MDNLLYSYLNTNHPLFEEFKSIISKTVGIEGSLRESLKLIKGIEIAFIYGSFASAEEKPSSDIDLMIIGAPNTTALNARLCNLEKKISREINPTIYSVQEYGVRKAEKRGFVTELIRKPKIMLIGNKNDL